jgi:DNA-binding protein HU-beta
MNKLELVSAIAESTGLSKAETQKAVQGFMDTVAQSLAKGEVITLVGFGGFSAVQRSEKTAKNLRTGEKIVIPARKAVKFRPGKSLSDAVNDR